MKDTADILTDKQKESTIRQHSTPKRMQIACFCSCILGIMLAGITGYYVLMAVFILVLLSILITDRLLKAHKISIETACLTPMLLLCFVYTPINWFTFNGLLGCTPYLSILFCIVIVLTYYSKMQKIVLSLYLTLMFGLTVDWLFNWAHLNNIQQVSNILISYIITISLTICILQAVKDKNIKTNELIKDLSIHDELTSLLNRRAMKSIFDYVETMFFKDGTEYALIILDVNQFKSINDLYGHNLGDSALRNFASCIQKCLRPSDYAFRMGGDEFLLLVPNADKTIASELCQHINQSLSEIHGYAFSLTASMGYALRSEAISNPAAMELADKRMYEAKKNKIS